jgi:hypothetical protein
MGLFTNSVKVIIMNLPVRTTLFQFSKNLSLKKDRSPVHRRFQTHLNLNKVKHHSDEFHSPKVLSPVKNLAIAFTERKRKNVAVCEIQEIHFTKVSSTNKKSSNKFRYFTGDKEKKSKLNIWINEKGTGLLTPAYDSMKSVKKFIQEVKQETTSTTQRLKNKSLPEGFRTRRTGSYETPRVIIRNISDVNSNCVCIQTDDLI